MIELYFGNLVSAVSLLLVAGLWAYVIIMIVRNKKTDKWGRRVALAASWGLIVCIFVAVRDGYDKSVQAMIDGGEAGLFTAEGIQSTLCSIGGGIVAISSLASIFIKNQRYRKTAFFTVSVVMMLKTLIIEISRIMLIGG